MASKQTRRSISISGETYDRLKLYCEQHGRSMSGVCEAETIKFLDSLPTQPKVTKPVSSIVKETKVAPVQVVAPIVPPVVEEVTPPSRVDRIKEVVEAKKPAIPLEQLDAASKIFTF